MRRVFGLQNHLDLDWLYDATSERREKLLSALAIAPEHARFVLDLDAIDEDDEDDPGVPVTPAIKLSPVQKVMKNAGNSASAVTPASRKRST